MIEVNSQPTETWEQLVELTETLYEEARLCRLERTSSISMADIPEQEAVTTWCWVAKHHSTALSCDDRIYSSLIKFWNNHPSLSYLFSSRFIGPTSQAPRFDESRHDAVYEMEIALSQLPPRGQEHPPWLVDRLFRDLLVDLTGNTHRAEICIDKLYSPDSSTGRLGLVELRGFEMPPHARMSLAQQLLIRAIVAAFWEQPYSRPLVHWGSTLHDQFMLPHYAWKDLTDVIHELRPSGIELDPAWFTPHHEFRFPRIGEINVEGIDLRLRSAIEPWYVMGEEPGGGGTVRCVDSSVERLEVSLDGLQTKRFRVTCNGVNVPLHGTGVQNQYVAGIRFRAWQPPRCLHPTIPIHCPLRFEIIDTRNMRSIGACTYHVADPGGRATDRFPINANEAEARRAARFDTLGMTGGPVEMIDTVPAAGPNPYPVTLDLRRI